jgi:hypothetical protein
MNDEYVTSSYAYKNKTKIVPKREEKKSEKEMEAYKKFIAAQVKLIEASKVYTNAYDEVKRLEKKWGKAYKEDN